MMQITEDTVERCLSRGDDRLAQVYATLLQTRALERLNERLEVKVRDVY